MTQLPPDISNSELADIVAGDADLLKLSAIIDNSFWYNFVPRPDDPANFDQQQGFVDSKDSVAFHIGGNAAGCLGAEQTIYDPVTKESHWVSEIDGPFHVWSRTQRGEIVIGEASQPKVYGTADLYKVTLSNGDEFVSTLGHRVLGCSGTYREVGKLAGSDCLMGLELGIISPLPARQDRSPYISTICHLEYLRTDAYWDFSVKDHRNYIMAGVVHSNTTEAAMFKLAKFVLYDQPPPRPNTPFWIISNTYEQVCGVCWDEKLSGHAHIPACEVNWNDVRWYSQKQRWPLAVPLKPWPGRPHNNWLLEFKSYEQGRTALQARSIGGFCFSEQFPLDLFIETLRGCREYMFLGGQFAEFTPIDPVLSLWVEKAQDEMPKGWAFYRANTDANLLNLADGWYENFFAAVPEEMVEVRRTGELASFEGVIYQGFDRNVHVTKGPVEIPPAVFHFRGCDWGASQEHPFTCVWGWRDGMGDWYIYDEYWCNRQTMIADDHAKIIYERSSAWGWPDPSKVDTPHFCQTYGDPSRPDIITVMNRNNIPTMGAANDVFRGIDCIRSLLKIQPPDFKPRLRIHENCTHLIEEMRKYRWLKGRAPTAGTVLNPKVAKPEPLKRDDDTVDALRYMVYSVEHMRGSVPGSMSYSQYVDKHKGIELRKLDDSRSRQGWNRMQGGSDKSRGWFRS